MKKAFLLIVFLLFSIISLSAKTIWICDETDNSFSDFYNSYWESMKDTKYGPYYQYVNEFSKIKGEPNDAIILLSGTRSKLAGGDIWYLSSVLLWVDANLNKVFYDNITYSFTWQYTASKALDLKKETIKYLDLWFLK